MNKLKWVTILGFIYLFSGCGPEHKVSTYPIPLDITLAMTSSTTNIPAKTYTSTKEKTATMDYKKPCYDISLQEHDEIPDWKPFFSLDGWKLDYPATWKVVGCRYCDPTVKGALFEIVPNDPTQYAEGLISKLGIISINKVIPPEEIISKYDNIPNIEFCTINKYLAYKQRNSVEYGYQKLYLDIFGNKNRYSFSFWSIDKKVLQIDELGNYKTFQMIIMTFEEIVN